ncbi:MAG: glycosyltransferase family 4 protein [Mycobacteriales bacterium]
MGTSTTAPPREDAIRLLFTHPFFWPHVRRGAEREVHGFGTRLVALGHPVTLVTGSPTGLLHTRSMAGMQVHYVRTPLPGPLARRGWTRQTVFGVVAGGAAAVSRSDAVVCFLYADAVGAALASRLTGHRRRPLVLKLTGAVPPERMASRPLEDRLLRRALAEADAVWANSRWAVEEMSGFGVGMDIVPAGVDTELFRPGPARWPDPVVLCTSAPADGRKRLVDLMDAWPAVLAARPEAKLRLAGQAELTAVRALLDRLPSRARDSVRWLGEVSDGDLPGEYARAWVTAAPALNEALGLTVLESLASGTPVVGAHSGAIPELLAPPGAGLLAEPESPDALGAALVAGLRLAESADTAAACRAAAQPYAWPHVATAALDRLTALVG